MSAPSPPPDFTDNPYRPPLEASAIPTVVAGRRPAGFWIRVLAILADGICLAPLTILSLYAVYGLKSLPLFLAAGLPGLFYKPLMESIYGGTLGKLLIGLRVQNGDGQNIGIGQAYLRFLPWLPQSVVGLLVSFWLFNQPEYAVTEGFMEIAKIMEKNPLTMFANILGWVVIIDCVIAAFNERKQA